MIYKETEWSIVASDSEEDGTLTVYTLPLQNKSKKLKKHKKGRVEISKSKDKQINLKERIRDPYKCFYENCNLKCFSLKTLSRHLSDLHRFKCTSRACSFESDCQCKMLDHINDRHSKSEPENESMLLDLELDRNQPYRLPPKYANTNKIIENKPKTNVNQTTDSKIKLKCISKSVSVTKEISNKVEAIRPIAIGKEARIAKLKSIPESKSSTHKSEGKKSLVAYTKTEPKNDEKMIKSESKKYSVSSSMIKSEIKKSEENKQDCKRSLSPSIVSSYKYNNDQQKQSRNMISPSLVESNNSNLTNRSKSSKNKNGPAEIRPSKKIKISESDENNSQSSGSESSVITDTKNLIEMVRSANSWNPYEALSKALK